MTDSASDRLGRLADNLKQGKPTALSRAITLVENETPEAAALQAALRGETGKAMTIGITGPPGAGKSTLVNAFIGELRRVRDPSVFRPTRTKSISIFIWLNSSEPVTNCASQNYSAWSRSIRRERDRGSGLYAEPNMGRRSDGRLQILLRRAAGSLSNFGQGSYW